MKEITKIENREDHMRITFKENEIPYFQDHHFPRGIPAGVEFVVEEMESAYRLVGEGYGALRDNPWGLEYNYGNGALYVTKKDLPIFGRS